MGGTLETELQEQITERCRIPSNDEAEGAPEDRFCKFCYSYENPQGKTDDLVSPCGCKGSIKYVHKYCLKIWRFKGKSLKDIKQCEQCFCEYRVDDEHKAPAGIVSASTLLILACLLLLTNIFLSSTADTVSFIAGDVSRLFNCGSSQLDFSFLGGRHVFVCNVAKTIAGNGCERGAVKEIVQKERGHSRKTYVYASPEGLFSGFFARIVENDVYDIFPTLVSLSLLYQLAFDLRINLLVNFFFSLWRLLVFGSKLDVALFVLMNTYIYYRIYRLLWRYVDSLYTYALNYAQ